ncbi:UDP-glycosyltransferase 83A1-like [Quercus robur]|uniref:UDP-glycosyltransferase 83A1-like n=1 Tax=Quercus robur TaxID=38942 RepID=UPI0021617936|nr:UDP-glycosyltransferase 83A1-like [Quercus robur]XP_050256102.1 UDP-glycosyltransferase 83A1-like [Quercus robur]XP_050256103.1 UDP-glycosyltransferase 83A1-like [Quercus robur]XP_050256104.1 UDP-glycosyltransferase 83A1-like [Quercus robur]XP_050256105.1 UDP-glycosyltransferase 83A1-like [Quercus robur]
MGSQPHVLVIPFPAQGHVAPLMKLSHQIVDHGIKVTFVTTEFINARLTTKMPANSPIRLVSLPDGLEPGDDQIDTLKLINSFQETKSDHFKDLIEKINESTDDRIIYVIADVTVAWAFDVAEKMGIQSVAFWPAGPANLALIFHIPKLIEDGIIDTQGTPIKNDLIWLSKEIPAWKSSEFPWSFPGESWMQNIFFQYVFKMNHCVKLCKWLLCNSFYELDLLALNLIPGIIPIGPLLSGNQLENHIGSFWPEDSTCLSWLDKQPVGSVIYASFGSTSTFNQQQFDELALGLELIGLPFLWVIRSDIANEALSEFLDGIRLRIADSGKIVGWAPQEQVLAHPSTACFISHCGWNSTLEGINMGVPFLCWPYFADQFQNKSYICDFWKVGLGLNPDENGIITRREINIKIKTLIIDDGIKTNALKLKEMAKKSVTEGGSSFKNFESFIEQIKR